MIGEGNNISGIISFLLLILVLTAQCGAQQQYFVERPQNTSVREGQTAVLRCKIGNQKGNVQWTKDGFALGFDRSIPAFPRYTIIGNEQLGEHHIRIENATLDDDAEYQCQVGPRDQQKPIRSDARLTVLVPPTTVEIMDYTPGARIQTRENDEVVLQCLVRNAKPAADIIWFKRNVEIKLATQEDTIVDSETNRRFDTRSKMIIRAQPDDNDADYTCEARHPALIAPRRTSVTLNVQYPPGPPEILGYTEGDVVQMGKEINLVCISRGGNPLAHIVWYKNDAKIDYSFNTSGRESRNTYTFKADVSDNNAKFRCEASNPLSVTPMKAEVTLTVHFPPKTVTITGPKEAKVGDTISLECKTSNSNPEARITWILDGHEVRENGSRITSSPDGGWISTSNLTTVLRPLERNLSVTCNAIVHELGLTVTDTKIISVVYPPQKPMIYGGREGSSVLEDSQFRLSCIAMGGNPLASLKWYYVGSKKEIKSEYTTNGNVATAKLDMTARREDNGKEVRCEATNSALDGPLTETTTIRVEFPPKQVSVRVRPEKLRPGQTATLTCESTTSNPPSRIVWLRRGIMVPSTSNSTSPGQYGGTISKSTLQFEITPDLDGAVFTCQASNSIGGHIHDAITLEVLYKPLFPHPAEYTVDVIEGQPGIVNMTARANPSEITYVWSRNGVAVKMAKDSDSSDRIIAEGPLLNLTIVRRSDAGIFKCEGTNAEGSHSTTVRLNVQYPASIVQVRSHVMVSEGGDAFLECQATGNPLTKTTVQWRRKNFDMETRTDQSNDVGVAYLTVKEVTRRDVGLFECVADNGIGEPAVEKTWLVVKYKPVMDESPQFLKAAGDEGQKAKLSCRAQGAPNVTFSWYREGAVLIPTDKYELEFNQVDIITWESNLYISNVRSRDYGGYDCIARNEMGFNKTSVVLSGTSRPDSPVSLRVLNVSHDSVELSWMPGFDGGLQQAYRIRYRQVGSDYSRYADVSPPNVTSTVLGELAVGTEYMFSVMAFNSLGESNYTSDIVRAKTSNPWDDTRLLADPLLPRGDEPKIIIIAISAAGSLLLLVNVILITCYLIRRRKKKCMEEAISSEGGSSKSATIEMYAPSSYNETVNGETLSSISEKSESYSHNGSHSDYTHEDASKTAVSTYLIDQGDGQIAYGSYRVSGNQPPSQGPGTLTRPPKSVNFDMGEDNYIDTLRRNAFTQVSDSVYGKSRGNPPIAASPDSYYNVNPSPVNDSSRYVAYPHSTPTFNGSSNRYNPLNEPVNPNSPYTPMGSLNIPAANGNIPHGNGYNSSGRISASLPVNLPLPLPLSMQNHGHFSSFNPEGSPIEATAQFSGPALATVRSLETEGHLV